MRHQQEWGGHTEIQALSLLFGVNVIIHQLNRDPIEIINFGDGGDSFYHFEDSSAEGLRRYVEVAGKLCGLLVNDDLVSRHQLSDSPLCIHLAYHDGEHYNSIRRKNPDTTSLSSTFNDWIKIRSQLETDADKARKQKQVIEEDEKRKQKELKENKLFRISLK
jgi:hypothetical protein